MRKQSTVNSHQSSVISRQSSELEIQSDGKRRMRQILTIVNLSIRRYLFTRYMFVLLIVGSLPLFFTIYLFLLNLINRATGDASFQAASNMNQVFQMIFRMFYLHFVIFFVANIFGFSLLRKEAVDRTLHLLFL